MKEYLSVYKNEQLIADRIEVGNTFWKRFAGLMGRKQLGEKEGYYLTPCNSVHTFQMKFPIDVLFLSDTGKVLDIWHQMMPWRITSIIKQANSVLELPAHTAIRYEIRLGDQLIFKPSPFEK